MWVPGSAPRRLPVIAEMLGAATSSGDADLIAEAHLLRAAALLELGDPAGRDELATYISLAEALGHARGRWGALTRRATLAQIAGRAQEAADWRAGPRTRPRHRCARRPGLFLHLRWSLVALGVPGPQIELTTDDPLWPMFPIFRAWPPAARKDRAATTAALGDFSVLDIAESTGTEGLAAAAVVFAVAGSTAQRSWVYERLLPLAGTHVLVTGCASYHAAVDHHLGALAAALGETARAEHISVPHWRCMNGSAPPPGHGSPPEHWPNSPIATATPGRNEFEVGRALAPVLRAGAHPATGLQGSAGHRHDHRRARTDVHVLTLIGSEVARTGADPILDDTGKAHFKTRLNTLADEIQDAEDGGNTGRAEQLRTERDALIHTLAAATGLGGRSRRLGDQSERARKTVSARVRDALSKINQVHPTLAEHLRRALRMGTVCSYSPKQPTTWTVG